VDTAVLYKKTKKGVHFKPHDLQQKAAPLLRLVLSGGLLVDETDEIVEDLIDVDLQLGGGLDKEAVVEALCHLLTLLSGNDTGVIQIALVADKNHGDIVGILHTEDLLTHVGKVVESTKSDDGVHEDEALTVLHVQITHGRELLGTGGIEDLEHALLAVDIDLLPVRILDCGIVLLDEDALNELDGKSRLTHTTRAENNNLILLKRHCTCDSKKNCDKPKLFAQARHQDNTRTASENTRTTPDHPRKRQTGRRATQKREKKGEGKKGEEKKRYTSSKTSRTGAEL